MQKIKVEGEYPDIDLDEWPQNLEFKVTYDDGTIENISVAEDKDPEEIVGKAILAKLGIDIKIDTKRDSYDCECCGGIEDYEYTVHVDGVKYDETFFHGGHFGYLRPNSETEDDNGHKLDNVIPHYWNGDSDSIFIDVLYHTKGIDIDTSESDYFWCRHT